MFSLLHFLPISLLTFLPSILAESTSYSISTYSGPYSHNFCSGDLTADLDGTDSPSACVNATAPSFCVGARINNFDAGTCTVHEFTSFGCVGSESQEFSFSGRPIVEVGVQGEQGVNSVFVTCVA